MAKYINLDKLNKILYNDEREAFSKHQVWLLLNYHPELIIEIGIEMSNIKQTGSPIDGVDFNSGINGKYESQDEYFGRK